MTIVLMKFMVFALSSPHWSDCFKGIAVSGISRQSEVCNQYVWSIYRWEVVYFVPILSESPRGHATDWAFRSHRNARWHYKTHHNPVTCKQPHGHLDFKQKQTFRRVFDAGSCVRDVSHVGPENRRHHRQCAERFSGVARIEWKRERERRIERATLGSLNNNSTAWQQNVTIDTLRHHSSELGICLKRQQLNEHERASCS